ncbi:MAG TPA: putative sulfate exporter family transporter [Firmicutes bacterium]|nr:putative sulfate exporter family transporter [Bacillota bacterium]
MEKGERLSWWRGEDWWTIWLGAIIIAGAALGLVSSVPKLPKWYGNVADALPSNLILPLLGLGLGILVLTGIAVWSMEGRVGRYAAGFPFVFLLAVLAYAIGNHTTLNHYGVNDIIWALILGMLFSNIFGKPQWLKPALRTELFIKTGLVLLGAEILFNRVLVLGVRGLGVAWLGAPLAVIFIYWLGTKVMKIKSKELVATVATATSVCGVSAAIATGASVRAKKAEISAAISISVIFTVIMMVGMPILIKAVGMNPNVAGAWIGGTVDSTGAVVVAGSMVAQEAMEVAAVVKMLQNALIGLISFVWAVYWVTVVQRDEGGERPSAMEIWRRFPKFVLGFMGASLVMSFLFLPGFGQEKVDSILTVTTALRGWLFALAFVTIGLDTKFSELKATFSGNAPVKLYVIGQGFNLLASLILAFIFFRNF